MNEQVKLFEFEPLPEPKKRQACKLCNHCVRVHYEYPQANTQSAAYYCGKKESSRTKNGLKKLYYVGIRNTCSLFSDQKPEPKPETMYFIAQDFLNSPTH